MIPLPFLVIPVVAWVSAQLAKFAASALRGEIDFKKLYESGGMPSAHTALISSITTVIGIVEGGSSALFGFALAITTIIIYDALGVRRASGLQAEAIRLLYLQQQKDKEPAILGSARGHSPSEVVVGGLLGVGLALLLTYEKSLSTLVFLARFPEQTENIALAAMTVIIVFFTTHLANRLSSRRLPTGMIRAAGIGGALLIWWSADNLVPNIGYRAAYPALLAAVAVVLALILKFGPDKTTAVVKAKLGVKSRKKSKSRRRKR